jgi:hypothetical protein
MANFDTLPAADAAVLCDDFIQAVESYFLWDRMKAPPHQVGTLEGILIGGCDSPEVFEARKIRAAVWIRDNGPALAAALTRHGFKPLSVFRIVGFIDDPDAVPSDFHREWKQIKARLQQAAIRLRNKKPTPPPGSGFPFTRDSYPLREVARDLEAIQEGYFLEQPEARAAHKGEGFARLETFCIAEAGEFTPAVLRKLCAVAARRTGKTLRDVLSLAIVPGLELLECCATSNTGSTPPAATPKQGEGNGATKPAVKAKRGRRADTDPKADKKVADAWATGHYRTYEDLGRKLKTTKHQVKTALDRHRHRVK